MAPIWRRALTTRDSDISVRRRRDVTEREENHMTVKIITSGTKVKKENNWNPNLKMISSGRLVKKK